MTEYQVAQQAVIGTSFDYWLGFKNDHEQYDPDNFLNARLEISGINLGNQLQINQRVSQKLKQIGASNYLKIPAYIIVTEFGTPISIIIQK